MPCINLEDCISEWASSDDAFKISENNGGQQTGQEDGPEA